MGGAAALGHLLARVPRWARVDDLDVRLLRAILEDGMPWGSRDPRLCANALARGLRVERTTVRDRLRRWQRKGFLQGYATMPTPALVGASLHGGALRFASLAQKPRAMEALAREARVVNVLDHVGPWVGIALLADAQEDEASIRRRLAAIPGVAEVPPTFEPPLPEVEAPPSALDWRLIDALMADPTGTLDAAARRLGVSRKTVTRRHQRLLRGHALWFAPILDFSAVEGALVHHVVLSLEEGAAPAKLVARLGKALPPWFYLQAFEGYVDAFVRVANAGEMARLHAAVEGLPGVSEAELLPVLAQRMNLDLVRAKVRDARP